jgi:cytohesin
LVEHNVDVNVRNSYGETPLHLTMDWWYEGSERTRDRRLDVVKFLLEHGADPDAKNDDDQTPLHHASNFGSAKGAQLMLEHGANVHTQDKQGRTPLHRVFIYSFDGLDTADMFSDTMRCLVEYGADIDALDNDYATPLHLASRHGCVKGAQLLLEHGANVHLKDKLGRTPFQVASEDGSRNDIYDSRMKERRREVMQLLSEYLQRQRTM